MRIETSALKRLISGGVTEALACETSEPTFQDIRYLLPIVRYRVRWDDDFQPKLGNIRSQSGKHGRKYLHRALQAAALAGGITRPGSHPRKPNFHGSQIGRGAGIGRVLSARDRHAAFRGRRVILKSRIVKLAGRGLQGARAHLRYIQRDGVTREGQQGQLYSAGQDRTDSKAFIDRAEGDRHQFRFIVAPEDGAEYADLKSLTRRLMAQAERDLGSKLDWVAVDHYNTGHPHSHIILRGKDDRGQDLVIARDYIGKGLRERAVELVSLDLGPRSDIEIENRLRQEIVQERLTSIDRRLVRDLDKNRQITTVDRDPFQQTLRAGRLQKLKRLGLAEEIAPSQWRLAPDLESALQRMGERGDIIKTMHREMARTGITRNAADFVINNASSEARLPVVGKVIGRGFSDELNDRHYLIVDGLDGRVHYMDIGKGDETAALPQGCIVSVIRKQVDIRQADRTVAEVAEGNGGKYSLDLHLRHDPTATANYADAHIRRLEAMRRAETGVERRSDGTWTIAPDHLEQALKYEQQQSRTAPVKIEMLSALPVERQIHADGATWLDQQLVTETPATLRDGGFGREVRSSLVQRRQWLIEQGLAEQQAGVIVYRANLTTILRQRELERIGTQLSEELGLSHSRAADGQRIEGVYRKRLDLVSGRFAVIANAREFSLVPWRPALERNLGKAVSGIARGDTVSWTFGQQRGGPSRDG